MVRGAELENSGDRPPFRDGNPGDHAEKGGSHAEKGADSVKNPGDTPPEVEVNEVREDDDEDEEEDEDAAVVDDLSLTRLLEPFGYLTIEQRGEVTQAWHEDSAGVTAWAGKALKEGDRPAALLIAGIRNGASRNPLSEKERFVNEAVAEADRLARMPRVCSHGHCYGLGYCQYDLSTVHVAKELDENLLQDIEAA